MSYVDLSPELQARADAIHREAIIIDGHSDILMKVADGKMRLRDRVAVPAEETWEPPFGMPGDGLGGLYNFSPHTSYFGPMGFYDIPRFLEGGLTSQGMAIYLSDDHLDRALHRTMEMIALHFREAEEDPNYEIVSSVEEIRSVKRAGKTSGFLTFEGFEPLGYDLKLLDVFAQLGLRMGSLTHSRRNAFGDGGWQLGDPVSGGLTQLGRDAVKRMNTLGIVIDLAHMNLRGSWEIAELSEAPIVLSHARSSLLAAVPSKHAADADLKSHRALWDAIAASGGVVGIIGYSQPSLEVYVDNIDETVAAIGIDHVGLGTDFYGYQRAPTGFLGMQDLPNLTAELVRRGYDSESIHKILGGNYLRVFEQVWR